MAEIRRATPRKVRVNVSREDHQVKISGKATGEDCDDPRAGEADGGERRKLVLLVLPYCPCKGCGESSEGCLLYWATKTNAN